jgi:hypothetical protein
VTVVRRPSRIPSEPASPDRGHSLKIDSGGRTVADTSLAFVRSHVKP